MSFEDTGESARRPRPPQRNLLRGRFNELYSRQDISHTARNVPLLLRQAWRYCRRSTAPTPAEVRIFLRIHCEQEPTSRSSITLTDQRDSLGLLRTRLDWQISDSELDTIRQVRCSSPSNPSPARPHHPRTPTSSSGRSQPSSPAATTAITTWAACACPPPPPMASSTPTFASTASRNIYICSSAVFPSSGFSNPTHTVLALAVRLAII